MAFRSTLMGAVMLAVTGVAGAQAQSAFPPVGQQQPSAFPPVGQASPVPPAGQQSIPFPPAGQQASPFSPGGQQGFSQPGRQEKPPCFDEFTAQRDEMQKRFDAAKAKIGKATAAEMCALLTKASQAETTMMKFVQQNTAKCQFPSNMVDNIKAGNVRTEGYRKQACTAAAAPRQGRRVEPTLSDALSPPPVGKDNTKTGSGTLDSLFGNPLAR